MTPDQLELIATSAGQATAEPRTFAESFYGHLFEIAPAVRPLFSDDLSEQYGKLVGELAFLAGAARDLETFSSRAHDLGKRHASYGVSSEMFEPVRASLVHAPRGGLGEAWTVEHEAAWTSLFHLIAQIMLDGATEASFSAG